MADLRDLLGEAVAVVNGKLDGRPRAGFRFGDMEITLRLDDKGRIPELTSMIGARRSPPSNVAWSIDVIGGSSAADPSVLPTAAGRGRTVLRASKDIYYLWLDEAGGYLNAIDRRSRRGLVWFAEPERIASWHIARPFLHMLKGISLETPWTPIHAAAVALNGRAVVAIGQSGAGKTSLAIACALGGWDYLGDDAIIVRGAPPTVAALYSSSRLRSDMFSVFDRAMTAGVGTSDDAGEIKAEIDMRALANCRTERASLAAILILDRSGAAQPVFDQIGRSDTIRRIMMAARQSIMGEEQAAFDKLSAIVRDVPCYRFDPGPDPFAVPLALAAMLEHGIAA